MVAVKNPEIRKAVNTLYELSADEKVRAEYEMRQKAWRDRISAMDEARENGEQKGRQERDVEIARNALAKGVSIELIHDITGLDLETIKRL